MELEIDEYSSWTNQSNNDEDNNNNNNNDPNQSIVPIHIQREYQSLVQVHPIQQREAVQVGPPDPTDLRERYQNVNHYRNQADFITAFTNGSLSKEHSVYLEAILKLMMEHSSAIVVKGGLGPLQLEVGQ